MVSGGKGMIRTDLKVKVSHSLIAAYKEYHITLKMETYPI